MLVALALAFTMIGVLATPAFAELEDYQSNPGRQQAVEVGAQCDSGAGSGAFGYFGGKDNNLGHREDGTHGANGPLTGLSNSGVCEGWEGNLP
jgi:hypothetical protein